MAATPPTPIDPAPTPAPQRGDRATFSSRVDAFVTWLTAAVSQFNAIATNAYNNALEALAQAVAAATSATNSANSATSAAASAAAAAANSNAPKWVTGTNYAQGAVVWSPTDFLSYRAKVALNPSTVDPASDPTNWAAQALQPFSSIEVLSISSDTSLTSSSKNVVRVASTVRGSSLLLPAGTSMTGKNGMFPIKNVGTFAIPLRDQSGALLAIIPGNGSQAMAVLEDGGTSAGVWYVMCPESFPAQAFAAATAEAATATWLGISAIPGTTNKALVAWISTTNLKCAIATRNASTGAVTLGATVTAVTVQSNFGAMVIALSSTTALVAGDNAVGVYRTRSMTLDTTANTITLGNNLDQSNTPTANMNAESIVALDGTRAAWLTNVSSVNYLNIATYATTPTGSQTSLNARFGNDKDLGIASVGSGNIMAISVSGNAIYTTSGNTPTEASFQSYSGTAYLPTNTTSALFGFAPQSGNKAVWLNVSDNSGAVAKDSAITITPSGTTVPTAPTNARCFPDNLFRTSTAAFVAGTSYCTMSSEQNKYAYALRVMRYSNDQLAEVAFGAIEGLPIGRISTTSNTYTYLRAAAVSGSACIAIGLNQSNQPQVFSLEVIKA